MKQLDLQQHRHYHRQRRQKGLSKATQVFVRETQVSTRSTRVTRKEAEKHEENKTTLVASENALIEQTSGNVLPNILSRQENRESEDEPMEIEMDNERDLSMHDTIVNRTTFSPLLHADAKDASPTVGFSASQLMIDSKVTHSFTEQSTRPLTGVDPRFYVCTSFASSQKTTTSSLGFNVADANSGVTSPPLSFNSSQSFLYHDYCMSESEFNITLPSQSESSEVAKITARSKEAAIFWQIEGDAFDEKAFFANTQVPLELDLVTDNDASP